MNKLLMFLATWRSIPKQVDIGAIGRRVLISGTGFAAGRDLLPSKGTGQESYADSEQYGPFGPRLKVLMALFQANLCT